ncbi:MAG: hypothetical protein ACOX2G_07150 [Bacillota bacterium]
MRMCRGQARKGMASRGRQRRRTIKISPAATRLWLELYSRSTHWG